MTLHAEATFPDEKVVPITIFSYCLRKSFVFDLIFVVWKNGKIKYVPNLSISGGISANIDEIRTFFKQSLSEN